MKLDAYTLNKLLETRIHKQQGPTVEHRELHSLSYNNL